MGARSMSTELKTQPNEIAEYVLFCLDLMIFIYVAAFQGQFCTASCGIIFRYKTR